MSCSAICDEQANELFSQHLQMCKIASFKLSIKPLENCENGLSVFYLCYTALHPSVLLFFPQENRGEMGIVVCVCVCVYKWKSSQKTQKLGKCLAHRANGKAVKLNLQ